MNKVVLIGNLARDPELRTLDSGVTLCRFTLAVNRRVPNAQGQREADFVNCVAWRQTAEFVSRYFTKGRKMALIGSIQVRSYEQEGVKRYSTEVVADEVEFVDRAPQGGSGGYDDGYVPPAPPPATSRSTQPMEAPRDDFVEVDDDELPF